MAEDSIVSTVHGLLPLAQAGLLLVRGRLHSLEQDPGHGTLGDGGALLQVLEDQLAARSPHNLALVGLGVVGQPAAVGDALHHFQASCRSESSNISLVVFKLRFFIWPLSSSKMVLSQLSLVIYLTCGPNIGKIFEKNISAK